MIKVIVYIVIAAIIGGTGYWAWLTYTSKTGQYNTIKTEQEQNEPNIFKRILGYTNDSPSPIVPFFGFDLTVVIGVVMVCIVLFFIAKLS